MLCFDFFGKQLRITFGFVFMLCAISMLIGIDFVYTLVVSCLIHELGHILAIICCKAYITKLTLSARGISINARIYDDEDKAKRVLVAAAGPLASAVAFFVFLLFSFDISRMCLIIAIYSLIPIEGFDGGDIINILINVKDSHRTVILVLYLVLALSVFAAMSLDNILIFAIFIYTVILSVFSNE